ncbi:Cupredoxin domain-containing protein [Rhodovastum atsumiense]|uniref:Cupredoxin domain-containing protein n=1 Tax=Rhodovastum atsumiense TaxID=504468 RepID=A0A5M6ITX0_9PROT|nr:cupredoxin domain-containing protein [Rhodovastum atsumiense]KAA5610978.1 cupredoxin domain-containing protein [Rhodovastum atsumiense]CAH2600244.1 Cupredoxin domain-containing protein [Rhodovastum atsumiense]
MRPHPAYLTEPDLPLSRTIALATGLTITFGCRPPCVPPPTELQVTLRRHRFEPAELHAPADTPIVLTVRNEDATAAEFGSAALKLGAVVAGQRQAVLRIPAQASGCYSFVGDCEADTARGVLVVGNGI